MVPEITLLLEVKNLADEEMFTKKGRFLSPNRGISDRYNIQSPRVVTDIPDLVWHSADAKGFMRLHPVLHSSSARHPEFVITYSSVRANLSPHAPSGQPAPVHSGPLARPQERR